MFWKDKQLCMEQFFDDVLFAKFKNGFPYSPQSHKFGIICGQVCSILDRAHVSQIVAVVFRLIKHLFCCVGMMFRFSHRLLHLCVSNFNIYRFNFV